MRLTPEVETTVRRYILGDLEEGLRSELEELLITDPEAFEALGVIEDELIDEFLDETCSPEERRRFEQHFLTSSQGLQRLRLARALRDRASSPARPVQPENRAAGIGRVRAREWRPTWVALAAALVLSLMGNVWQSTRYLGRADRAPDPSAQVSPVPSPSTDETGTESKELQARLEAERQERSKAEARVRTLEQQLERPRPRVATFALVAGLLRGEGTLPRVSVPADALVVGLRLELPGDDYRRYRAALLDANGEEIFSASKLRAEGVPGRPAVALLLPSGILPRGDYQVKLSGLSEGGELEAIGTYAFRVSVP